MKRLLPPLLVLLVLAVVVVRALGRPARGEMQTRIRGMWTTLADRDACSTAIREYLEAFDEEQDRWFGAEAFLRTGDAEESLALIFGPGGGTPGDARRYGEMGLMVMGWDDAERTQAREEAPAARVAFGEAGEPWALKELEDLARDAPMSVGTSHWFLALRHLASPAMAALCRGLREHVTVGADYQLHARIAAGIAELGRPEAPGGTRDEDTLVAFLPKGRRGSRDAWGASAVALGRAKTERGLAAIRREEKLLKGSSEPADLALLRCGYVAAGNWEEAGGIVKQLTMGPADGILVETYTQAVIWRFLQGDARAAPALGALLGAFAPHQPSPRRSITFALLLGPRTPDDLGALPVEQILRDLEGESGALLFPTLAAIFRMRRGDADGLARVVARLRTASASAAGDTSVLGEAQQTWLAGLRGMLLYGPR